MFTGRELQQESGLYNYRNRFYHPGIGQFLQSDPIGFEGGDVNIYTYVWNNSPNWTDPWGLYGVGAPNDNFFTQFQDGTYEALNAMAGGCGPSTGNDVAADVGLMAGVIAPLPGGKISAVGKFTKITWVVRGKGGGASRAVYTVIKDSKGRVIKTFKDSYDRANRFMHRKPLRGGPEGRSKCE